MGKGMVKKLHNFWRPNDTDKAITVIRTDKCFLRGVHRGEPIWKVARGESYMFILQEEATAWNNMLQDHPELAEDQKVKD